MLRYRTDMKVLVQTPYGETITGRVIDDDPDGDGMSLVIVTGDGRQLKVSGWNCLIVELNN